MNLKQIQTEYPLTWDDIIENGFQVFGLNDFYNNRHYFDFIGIIGTIKYDITSEGGRFRYKIYGFYSIEFYAKDRKEAEKQCIKDCFTIRENQLRLKNEN